MNGSAQHNDSNKAFFGPFSTLDAKKYNVRQSLVSRMNETARHNKSTHMSSVRRSNNSSATGGAVIVVPTDGRVRTPMITYASMPAEEKILRSLVDAIGKPSP